MSEHVHSHDHSYEHTHSPSTGSPSHSHGESISLKAGFSRLLSSMRPYWGQMIYSLGCGLANHITGIASAVVGAFLVGAAATGSSVSDLWPGFVVLAVLVIVRAIAAWQENWQSHDTAFKLLAELRLKVYWALERLAPGYLVTRRSGDLATSALEDVDLLELFFAHTAMPLVVALVVPFGALIGLAFLHWTLPLVLLPWVVLVAVVPFILGKRAESQGQAVRGQVGELAAEVVDSVQGLREVVVFGQETTQLNKLDGVNQTLERSQISYGRRAGLESAVTVGLTAFGMLSVLAVAAALVAAGNLTRSLYPVAVILAGASFAPVLGLADTARSFGLVQAAARRVFKLLDEPAPVTDRVQSLPPGPVSPHIEFEKASFRYGPTLPLALSQVSFEVRAGETVALVGHSGAGKSTCSQLLLRFWDVDAGSIKVGSHDLRDFPQEELRSLMALVPQDIYLFNTTLRENIRLGNPQASDGQVEAAARAAQAHDFIEAMPEGYDTFAGERGVQLSGGQRQRLAIARALLKDAPILVMDEAVSNLDTESEQALHVALTGLLKDRTTLLIAHRLSTIRTADRIVVLEGGKMVETGTHEELLALDGSYSRLIASQRNGILPG